MQNKINLSGKKLLILGDNAFVIDMVRTAQKLGAYVIVTGFEKDNETRRIADEAISISTLDHDAICKYIKENKVNGVFASASEFNVQNMIAIAEKAGLPCYATRKQWDLWQNKRHFKDCCTKYGVPVPPEYSVSKEIRDDELKQISYPVIVKPVDSCSSQGITVCFEESELKKAYEYALSFSASKEVVIEKYLTCNGVNVIYTVQNGVPTLSELGDWYRFDNNGKKTTTRALYYPSKGLDIYLRDVDAAAKQMIIGEGIKFGLITFQTFFDGERFYAFEACLRIPGNNSWAYISHINKINYLEMLIAYAVTGEVCGYRNTDYDDVTFKGKKVLQLAFDLYPGKISVLEGIDEIRNIPEVVHVMQKAYLGHEIAASSTGTLLQELCRIHMVADDTDSILKIVERIKKLLVVKDEQGNSMLVEDWAFIDEIKDEV